jgi:hypothetical protein
LTPDAAINLIAQLGGIGLLLVIMFTGMNELRSIRAELTQQNEWLRHVVEHLIDMDVQAMLERTKRSQDATD